MIRRPPRSTLSSSSAASDVYKRQLQVACERQLSEQHLRLESASRLWDLSQSMLLESLAEDVLNCVTTQFGSLATDNEEMNQVLAGLAEDLVFQVVYPGKIQGEAGAVARIVQRWAGLRGVDFMRFMPPHTFLTERWKQQVMSGRWLVLPEGLPEI
eukprot:TRINITY_DN596_c0_g1_i1.p1 TRINITY_DN596_c0_g1~~TRINITY_DN596_c0_g1_i1.p1  ORF type:complete len:156 (+),score=40.61 TRINITY_DN596_c0_g1_i1:120-587(+)